MLHGAANSGAADAYQHCCFPGVFQGEEVSGARSTRLRQSPVLVLIDLIRHWTFQAWCMGHKSGLEEVLGLTNGQEGYSVVLLLPLRFAISC